jgi:hypothetical protein
VGSREDAWVAHNDHDRGNELEWVRIDNDPKVLVREVRTAGRGAPVAIEATYG